MPSRTKPCWNNLSTPCFNTASKIGLTDCAPLEHKHLLKKPLRFYCVLSLISTIVYIYSTELSWKKDNFKSYLRTLAGYGPLFAPALPDTKCCPFHVKINGSKFRIECVWVIRPPAPGPHIRRSAPDPHKIFNKLNLLLIKVQSLWSCAHYFQWFTGLNHVDLRMLPRI